MLYQWFQHIEFAFPEAFILLAILPLMAYWYLARRQRYESSILVSSVHSFAPVSSWKTTFSHIPFVLRLLVIVCLVIVLARPHRRNDEQMIGGEGVDIMLCMDVSGSMLAQDFTPNRMEAMKQVAANFVDKRPTDRIGLVIFAGESFTACPVQRIVPH